MTLLLIELNKPVKFYWRLAAYLDMSNQNNCNRLLSTNKQAKNDLKQNLKAPEQIVINKQTSKKWFKTEFESTWAIKLKQLFASGLVNIVKLSPLVFILRILQQYSPHPSWVIVSFNNIVCSSIKQTVDGNE